MVAEGVLATRETSWSPVSLEDHVVLAASAIGALIAVLARQRYSVIGPTVHDGAIVYGA